MGMRKKAVKRSWLKHNVPMEIWSEILAKLPARSLVRFRSVSKSWKTVIDSPEFCQDHLKRSKNNRNKTHFLMVEDEGHCFLRCSDKMKTIRRLGCLGTHDSKTQEYKSTATPGFNCVWSIWFSVDGLVLLKCIVHAKLMLWNHSIRKCRYIPHSHESRDIKFLELGLGFDPLIKDYKIVRVGHKTPSKIEIYTLGTASWRIVESEGTVPSSWVQTASGPRSIPSIYFKACLYIRSASKLISFDLSREMLKSIDLPDNLAPKESSEYTALTEWRSSLAVLGFSNHGGSIWVLDDNTSSWSMLCKFTMRVPCFLYLKKNGDMLYSELTFDYQKLRVISYNIYTEEERITGYRDVHALILDYKESFVLMK